MILVSEIMLIARKQVVQKLKTEVAISNIPQFLYLLYNKYVCSPSTSESEREGEGETRSIFEI